MIRLYRVSGQKKEREGMQMCSLNKVQMEKGQEGEKNAGEIVMSGGAFMWSEALKIIFPACLDEITGWLRLFQSTERLRQRLFTFTFSCSGLTRLSAETCSWCWAGSTQVGVSVWGLGRNGIHPFLFSSK